MNYADRVLLARRYARAFTKAFSADLLTTSSQPFFDFYNNWKEAPVLIEMLAHTANSELFIQCARQLITHFKLDDNCMDLLQLLYKKGRIGLFPDVCYYIGKYLDESQCIERARLFCMPGLTLERQKKITQLLSKKRGGVRIVFSVIPDDSLIAGVRVLGSGWIWERSIAQTLRALEALCRRHAT